LGQRSRKRGRRTRAADAPAPPPRRSELRNEAVRAALTPLEPGERPWAIKISALIAVLVGAGDLIDVIVGGRIRFGSTHAGIGGIVLFALMMLICSAGSVQLRYWAVLGLEGLLGILLVIFSLFALRLSSVTDLIISVAILVPAGAT